MIHQKGWEEFPGWSMGKVNFLVVLDIIVSVLSLLGSIILFFFCIRLRSPKTLSVKFITALALSDVFYSTANILSNFLNMTTAEELFCQIQGSMRYCSFILSIYFSACTAIVSYQPSSFLNRTNSSIFVTLAASTGLLIFLGVPILW